MPDPALPRLGATLDGQQPMPEDDRLWSVTTLLGVLDKPALVSWAANETAKAAVANIDTVAQLLRSDGAEAAVEYLSKARYKRAPGRTMTAKDLGSAVHTAVESYVLNGRRPDDLDPDVAPFVFQFERFLDAYQPEFVAAEVTVFSPAGEYAGTADAFVRIGGTPLILDYKTSWESYDGRGRPKKPYPEVALQLAAYRYAEFAAAWRVRRNDEYSRRYYLLGPDERALGVPVPEVDGGLAVLLTPDRYAAHMVSCGPAYYETFLFCRELARWQFNEANGAVRGELIPPARTEGDPFAGLPR